MKLIFDDFSVIVPNCEEIVPPDCRGIQVPEYLSSIKCKNIGEKFPQHLVIAADTVVIHNEKILGKPENRQAAFTMLSDLSGKEHTVCTGVTLGFEGHYTTFSAQTSVCFHPLGEDEINSYIATGEPMDKAGAYGIQGRGALLVKSISGDFYNVVGLPVAQLNKKLNEFLKKYQSK